VKKRPCLVLERFENAGKVFVELAYGTTVQTKVNRGYEIQINTIADMALAGLHRPTRFIGARRIIVAADNPGFVTNPGHPSPVIGRLDEAGIERMDAVRKRILEEQDVATKWRATTTHKPVVVAQASGAPVSKTRRDALAAARRRAAEAGVRRAAR
jgi:hypothetical protein